MQEKISTLRLDTWLWRCRFFKTRSLATRMCREKGIRLNGERIKKPATNITAGQVLTFMTGKTVRIIKITGLPERRGPAPEAQSHYMDLTPAKEAERIEPNAPSAGRRPTKKERRALMQLKSQEET